MSKARSPAHALSAGMMDLPEVQAMLADPAKLREMLVNNPMLDAMPGMREQMEVALASDAFSDPVKLKAAMTEGMAAFKSAGKEFTQEIGKNVQDMMANPEKMNEALKALGLGGAGGGDMAESLQQMAAPTETSTRRCWRSWASTRAPLGARPPPKSRAASSCEAPSHKRPVHPGRGPARHNGALSDSTPRACPPTRAPLSDGCSGVGANVNARGSG
ncbi:hypothetical protein M885DRAFT_271733 [Pelagophyceae sp. CCMP2097]|nr:hypothetical protein M885DRAFT_271733 [Pelagophyceae sp. CCMP2097]